MAGSRPALSPLFCCKNAKERTTAEDDDDEEAEGAAFTCRTCVCVCEREDL